MDRDRTPGDTEEIRSTVNGDEGASSSTTSTRPLFRPAPLPDRRNDERPADVGAVANGRETHVHIHMEEGPEPDPLWRRIWSSLTAAARSIASNWAVAIPLALFAIAAMIVPTMTNLALTDDWGYTRSVEILYYDARLTVFPVVAATAVGQILWGGLFALLFGMELGVMRLSTVVMVALGAMALYAILRQLGVSRGRSALGMAAYLFNPLSFILSFTFMTDPHFTSVMLIAVAFYLRGLHPERPNAWMIVIGSLAAGYAFWIRQQGALIPLAVVLYLVATRRLWFNWQSVRLGLQVALAPAIMFVAYYGWLRWFNDVPPTVQQNFLQELRAEGWDGTWQLVRLLTYFELAYLGLFAVPLLLAIVPALRARDRTPLFSSPVGFWLFLGWASILVTGLYFFTLQGRKMPYIPQFLGASGFGSPDVRGSRVRVIEWPEFYDVLTVVSVVAAVVLGLMLCRRVGSESNPERAAAGVVLMVLLWQVIGVMPPSYHYLGWASGSLDRYLLPLIPLTIALLLWALRDVRLFQPIGWLIVGCLAAVSTAGTHDYLVFMDAVWDMGRVANAAGVPNTKLDAGSGWDGYHLYTLMLEENITKARSPGGSPWWVYFYAKPTDSTYFVSTNPNAYPGYVMVQQREYDQWLEDDPVFIYLMRHPDAPWPP